MVNDGKRSFCQLTHGENILSISPWNNLHHCDGSRFFKNLTGKREPKRRLARGSLYIQQFNTEIHYRPGKLHENADPLSRSSVYVNVTSRYFVESLTDRWVLYDAQGKTHRKSAPGTLRGESSFKILPNDLLATARRWQACRLNSKKRKQWVSFGL